MITVRATESIKRMKEAGKFPQRWCQQNRRNISAIPEQDQAAALQFQQCRPRAPPAELWDSCSHSSTAQVPGKFQICSKGIQIYSLQPELVQRRAGELLRGAVMVQNKE